MTLTKFTFKWIMPKDYYIIEAKSWMKNTTNSSSKLELNKFLGSDSSLLVLRWYEFLGWENSSIQTRSQ